MSPSYKQCDLLVLSRFILQSKTFITYVISYMWLQYVNETRDTAYLYV